MPSEDVGDPWIPAMVAEAGFCERVAMTATAFCSLAAQPNWLRRVINARGMDSRNYRRHWSRSRPAPPH
jgi:hypothetical protein